MNPTCPTCNLKFEREPGYFVGAMYVSYLMAVPIVAALSAGLWYAVVPGWRVEIVVLIAGVLFLPFVPIIFRYSRIIWIHLGHLIDPPQ